MQDTTSTADTLYVAFTCDVEGMYPRVVPTDRTSAWETGVNGRVGSESFGVPLLMDMLEQADARGTFFVDVNAVDVVGYRPVAQTCEALLSRGHDVQLHYHAHYNFAGDPHWRELHLADQVHDRGRPDLFPEVIGRTADRFEKLCGFRAAIYRAGGYHFRPEFAEPLRSVGVKADATCWPDPRHRVALPGDLRWRNNPFAFDGLLYIPITHYAETGPTIVPRIRQLNFAYGRRPVYEALLRVIGGSEISLVSIMSHSISFVELARQGATHREMAQAIRRVHDDDDGRLGYQSWIDGPLADEVPLQVQGPDWTRRDEYDGFFLEIGGRPDREIITLAEYVRRIDRGDARVPSVGPLLPLPRFDLGFRSAILDYVRRYDYQRLRELDALFRRLPKDASPFLRPPQEVVEHLAGLKEET